MKYSDGFYHEAHEVQAHEVQAHEVQAHEVQAHEVQAHEVQAHEELERIIIMVNFDELSNRVIGLANEIPDFQR